MKSAVAGIAAAMLLASPNLALAQEQPDTFRLREVVVTATRLPTPAATAPGSVTVLTREELSTRGIRFAADALRLVPGVAVMQSAGPGSQSSVFMRGGESDYVQVLVDGVQVNEPGGAFDWGHLRVDDIERIEIVRGPASVLYGSDAVSGVVQIFTRTGGRPRIEAGATSGRGDRHTGSDAYITNAFDVGISGSTVRGGSTLRYGASASHLGSTGLYERNSDYDNTHLAGRLHYSAARGDIALTARRGDSEYWYPTTGSGAIVAREQFALGETLSLSADAGLRVRPRIETRVLATAHAADSRTENPPSEHAEGSFMSTSDIARRKLDGRINAMLAPRTMLTVGVERQWQHARTALESLSGFGPYRDSTDARRNNTAYYAQLHATPAAPLTVTLGGRIDDNDVFGTFSTGRAAANWTPLPGTRLHGAIGTAFKEPTFFETYAQGFTRGNPSLAPEHARSGEVGGEYTFARAAVVAGATWFHQRFRNLIQYTATPAPETPNYVNIGEAQAHGAELSLRAARGPFSARAAHTFTRTRVRDEGFGTDAAFQQGSRLLRRPQHLTTVSAGYQTRALKLLVDARRVGERDDLDFTDPGQWAGIRTVLPAHTVVDAAAEYRLLSQRARTLDVTARVRNVFDREYQEIYNFPTAGRVLQLGMRGVFGF